MLKNYLTIALRNLVRNKVYSAINIVGLAIGIASCVLIFLYIQDELSYESHFKNTDRIVRIAGEIHHVDQINRFALSPPVLAPHIIGKFPEIEHITQLLPAGKQTIWHKNKSFNEEDLIFADSAFFHVFSYELLAGDRSTALNEPLSIVLSQEMALKYFGSVEEAIGNLLKFSRNTYKVTGVYLNQGHSHIPARAFLSRSSIDKGQQDVLNENNHWFHMNRYTYVLLHDASQAEAFQEKLDVFADQVVAAWIQENELDATMKFLLQPLSSIHFDTTFLSDMTPPGNINYIYIFAAVALFLLLIASINYMNLSTARSAKRAKEVGLRKVVGAYRSQIVSQFIGESLLITLLAVVLALALVQMMLPLFNSLTDKQFNSNFFLQTDVLIALAGIILFIGVVAGSYPAFFLSGFKPVDVLKTGKSAKGGSVALRKVLVVVQFSISLIMIIGTIVVFTQMHFLKNKDLGFNKEQVLIIDIPEGDSTLAKQLPVIERELLGNPNIERISFTNSIPADRMSTLLAFAEKDGGTLQTTLQVMFVGYDFIETLGIEMAEGRKYSRDLKSDHKKALIVNEAAVKKMGWKEPIGKELDLIDWDAKVIGVVKDFHVASLHSEVEPMVLALVPESKGFLLARIKPENMAETISFIEGRWRSFDSKHPMEYFFLDEHFDKQYRAEEKMLTVFGYFAALTILIACLGLFGLASFTAEQRTKEIGIRKVLGSSNTSIVVLLSKDFAVLVLIAIVLATPLAWYGMDKWLQDFAFRTELSWWIFVLAGFTAMSIALLTVSFQALKAATLDPVKAIRTQ